MIKNRINDRVLRLPEYHHFLFGYLLYRNNENIRIRKKVRQKTKQLIKDFIAIQIYDSPLTNLESLVFIHRLQKKLEDELKRIISKRSLYYWIHLFRRFRPGERIENESWISAGLWREILESAFQKYGRIGERKELLKVFEGSNFKLADIAGGYYEKALREYNLLDINKSKNINGIYLSDFSLERFEELMYVENIAYEYWCTTVSIRRIYKGGKVSLEDDVYHTVLEPAMEELVNRYDKRSVMFTDLCTSIGTSMVEIEEKQYVLLLPVANVEELKLNQFYEEINKKLGFKHQENFVPNYILLPIDLETYYQRHKFLSESFVLIQGVAFEHVLLVVYLLFHYAFMRFLSGELTIQYIQRGYMYIESIDALVESLLIIREKNKKYLRDCTLTKENIRSTLKMLLLENEIQNKINLTTRGPRRPLFNTDYQEYVVDFSNMIDFLKNLPHEVKGNLKRKGYQFEEYVKCKLDVNVGKLDFYRSILLANDGTKKEIDIGFYVSKMLIVLELRTTEMSFAYEIGDTKSLEFRKRKIERALADVDDKAEWLSKRVNGRNYSLRQDTIGIFPIVITPFKEFIWSLGERYWVTESIPRVCLIGELQKMIADGILGNTQNHAATRYVRGH